MRTITLLADNKENQVPLFEIGDATHNAIEGTLAVIEETNEVILYYSDRWNTIGYAERVSGLIYRVNNLVHKDKEKENGQEM